MCNLMSIVRFIEDYLVARHQGESCSSTTGTGDPSDPMYEEFRLARKVEIDDIVL